MGDLLWVSGVYGTDTYGLLGGPAPTGGTARRSTPVSAAVGSLPTAAAPRSLPRASAARSTPTATAVIA